MRPERVSTTASADAAGTMKQPCAGVSIYSAAHQQQISHAYHNIDGLYLRMDPCMDNCKALAFRQAEHNRVMAFVRDMETKWQ